MPHLSLAAPVVLEAVRYERRIERGRSLPPLVTAVDDEGGRHLVVLKLRKPGDRSIPWQQTLARELAGAMLGRLWGLAVPEYSLVRVTDTFVESLRDMREEYVRMADNRGLVFGSEFVEPSIDAIPEHPETWEPPIQFDAFCFNPDRKTDHPNVVWDGENLYLIDHGLIAATWEFDRQGVADTELYGNTNIGDHAGYRALRRAGMTYASMPGWSATLDDALFGLLRRSIPAEWASDAEYARLRRFLEARSATAAKQAEELRETLA